jgi:hypothetical protein
VLVPALLPPFTGLLEAPAPRAFGLRGLVNDRFLAALAAISLPAATPMVCAAVMATFLGGDRHSVRLARVFTARLATVHGHADLRPPGGDLTHTDSFTNA